MKTITLLTLIGALALASFAQNSRNKPSFDVEDFNKKFETAQWLVEYDVVAWKTTDFLLENNKSDLERLGRDWFCFRDAKDLWHAVYGRYENGKYTAVVHLTFDSKQKISPSDEKIDQKFLDLHALALQTARKKLMSTVPEGSPAFNQYIRQNSDKTFTVWMMPAFQTNGVAVYGGEGIYTLDQTAGKILKDESYFQSGFRGFKAEPPREIWLNYRETEKPTLGAVFFVWYYKDYFTKIFIDNAKTTSTLMKLDGQGYTWVNVEKDEKNEKNEKK